MFKQEDLANHLYTTTLESNLLLTSRIAYDGNGNALYMGVAAPGLGEEQAGWLIRKIEYDNNQRPEAILFAAGDANFNKIWDDRATYAYS
ncbi:MAG: hypothetical protein G8345_02670 [Magnetococcales bacterium]|nr:hypothetical protein [Magnetococcales bacterium]